MKKRVVFLIVACVAVLTFIQSLAYADWLDWIKYTGNPVLTGTAPTGSPCVLEINNEYHMWYIKDWDIWHATSPDGKDWTNAPNNPVLADGRQLALGTVRYTGTSYQMWYSWGGATGQIGYATSYDGTTWDDHGLLIGPGPDSYDEYVVSEPSVMYDGTAGLNNRYKMWYQADDYSPSGIRIAYATSPNPDENWTKHGLVFEPNPNSWYSERIGAPFVEKIDDNEYIMWFFGGGSGGSGSIGHVHSQDGINWDHNTVQLDLARGLSGEWDNDGVSYPWVLLLNDNSLILYYGGRNGPGNMNAIGLAQFIVNHPPVIDPPMENVNISSEELVVTTIQGTATDEEPADILEYRWLEGETVLLDWTHAGENGECPLDLSSISLDIGTHTLTLEVTDGQETVSDDMILTIDNSAPHVAPTGGGVYEVNTEVTLGGNVSDFDGDLLQYEWKEGMDVLDFGTIQAISGGTPVQLPSYITSNLSLGIHIITLQVDDGTNDPVSNEITVEIVDTTVPTLAPVPNKTILWPPNHNMVDIVIEANVSDNSGLPVTLTASVISNEPEDGLGDGDMAPDWTDPVINQETGIVTLQLRAERSGSGDGRVYTIAVTATDESGNSSSADVNIIVPHDNRKK